MSDDEIVHDWESDCYVLHAANTHLRNERERLRAENEKLRAILFQFAAYDDDYENDDSGSMTVITVPIGVIRAAAAALKETDND